jgi:shikimate dehydrogenase
MPRLAVLGQPIAHSRSPAMQSAALADLGLAGEWSYEAIEVAPEDFAARVGAMPGEDFVGANVTIPHKLAALAVADEASDVARAIGAANTLSFADGRIEADNTDAAGFLAALPTSAVGARALVLGAGGSARAVVWALLDAGASVSIWNRTRERAERLGADLGAEVADPGPGVLLPLADFDLLVNTTSVGMELDAAGEGAAARKPDLKSLSVDADALGERHTVVDLVYGAAETALAAAARERGARVIDGLEVLVHQGAASLRIWTGREPPIETMRRAARDED